MNTSKHTPKKPKELDLRYAKPEAQAYVREQAIRLHHEGWTNVDIAKHFNVHQNTVGKWIKRARTDGVEGAINLNSSSFFTRTGLRIEQVCSTTKKSSLRA